MIEYPSISYNSFSGPVFVFDKLDGSNIRAKWTKKKGFELFGTRRRLFDETDQIFGEAKILFLEKYSEELNKRFTELKINKAQVYYEYWSPNSFAGFHENEPHNVTIFDIDLELKGIISPKEFLKITKDLDTAKLLHYGNLTNDIKEKIKNGTLEGMTFEGVICKQFLKNQTNMFKLKSDNWFLKLRSHCKEDKELFEKLC